jgi:hypothetical protein
VTRPHTPAHGGKLGLPPTAGSAVQKPPRGHPLHIRRTTGLETAAAMLGGQDRLAAALGINPRSLRAKLSAERGISSADLRLAAGALEVRAALIDLHARKLREEAAA